jgi:hypothetical protein
MPHSIVQHFVLTIGVNERGMSTRLWHLHEDTGKFKRVFNKPTQYDSFDEVVPTLREMVEEFVADPTGYKKQLRREHLQDQLIEVGMEQTRIRRALAELDDGEEE